MPKYPNIVVPVVGMDGNAFAIMGRVVARMSRAKVATEEIDAFQKEAMSGDYNDLLATCAKWVTVN